jgi:hypothetical protein
MIVYLQYIDINDIKRYTVIPSIMVGIEVEIGITLNAHLILFTSTIDSVSLSTILSNNDSLLTVSWLNLPIVRL